MNKKESMKVKMARVRSFKKNMKGGSLVEDIISKGRNWILDKAHQAIKDKKLVSKGLTAASLANPTWAPITAPLAGVASLFGYGKNKKNKMMY